MTHKTAIFVHGEVILHVKPPLTWLSHWRLSRKTDPLSWSRPRGRKKAAGRRARAALHARGGGPILEDEEIRALRMRRRDGLPDQADRRHVNGGLTWRGDFREKGGSAIESACRARICRSSSSAAPASCEMPGSLPLVTGSDAGRARFAYPSRACSPLAVYRAARLPAPGGAVVPSRNVTRAVFRSPPCRSPTSRLQSPWRAILDRLHVSSFVAPQTKALKCPLRFATGTSNVGFQWESRLLLARLR